MYQWKHEWFFKNNNLQFLQRCYGGIQIKCEHLTIICNDHFKKRTNDIHLHQSPSIVEKKINSGTLEWKQFLIKQKKARAYMRELKKNRGLKYKLTLLKNCFLATFKLLVINFLSRKKYLKTILQEFYSMKLFKKLSKQSSLAVKMDIDFLRLWYGFALVYVIN